MGIDAAFLERLASIGKSERIFPGGSVLILGDCKFYLPWASGDNAVDRAHFKESFELGRVETIDIAGAPSIVLDLQKPVPESLRSQFDMVIDAGTLFWCFDIAAVLKNCFDMMKDTGVIVHLAALTGHFGRGYYNIHPTLFRDVYTQNGFEIISTEVRVHKQTCRLAKWQRTLWEWGKMPVGEFRPIPKDATYLKNADFVKMDFTAEVATMSPMLPNDALLLYAARRHKRAEFVRPLPSLGG